MVWQILIFILLALILSYDHRKRYFKEQLGLFFSVFSVYSVFTVWSDSYVENPLLDFFVSSDQLFFYRSAINLSYSSAGEAVREAFSTFEYSETPLSIALFALLAKFAIFLGVGDILLFLKFHVTFLASLIPLFIYKTVRLKDRNIPYLWQKIFVFALMSPLLIYSGQLLRDIHVGLLFLIMTYVALKPKQVLRYPILLLLMVATYYLRMESGLFSVLIIGIPLYKTFRTGNIMQKTIILSMLLVFCFFAVFSIYDMMTSTITRYAERSAEMASESSLGNKLNALPTPIGEFAKAAFSQLMPFPIWLRLTTGLDYAYLYSLECLYPFYWVSIWMALLYAWKKYHKVWDKEILALFYISILYIILNSAGEFNVRRIMAVYPMILICYLLLRSQFDLKKKMMNQLSFTLLFMLHVIYMLIK